MSSPYPEVSGTEGVPHAGLILDAEQPELL